MARIRTVKPEFWSSESVGRLSHGARLLFLGALNFADDEGLIRWTPVYLMSQVFIYDELSTERVTEWMGELVRERMVLPYGRGSPVQKLGWIVNFREHQVINRPQRSKLPPPNPVSPEVYEAIFLRDRGKCHLCGELVGTFGKVNVCGSKVGSVDHLQPLSRGGSDYPSNLKLAHISCNKSRGNRELPDSVNGSVPGSVGEWKGMEGNGREEELDEAKASSSVGGVPAEQKEKKKRLTEAKGGGGSELRARTWAQYDAAYLGRYGQRPVRNARANALIAQAVERLGADAPEVVAFYVRHPGAFYATKLHPLTLFVADAEGLRTQWAKGLVVTASAAASAERTASRFQLINEVIEKGRVEREAGVE